MFFFRYRLIRVFLDEGAVSRLLCTLFRIHSGRKEEMNLHAAGQFHHHVAHHSREDERGAG